MRRRYWGRAMAGWRDFAQASPNEGHKALAKLENMKIIGVEFEDDPNFYDPDGNNSEHSYIFSNGSQHVSILTQNVDGLHKKAGSRYVTELHGR
eukprot:CAMPEP_0184870334 /NCGR_PEP_ID=MMETSP0580-20130426/37136_1 /TAXON_ID=1118495 /ORGANISM="Dactyliosolen fragilissimus" /LENGTH=93 /DNA_ID=CAMNT_0027372357 /DNA_START=1 /DNA_END=278 /DNA_ORIENTATION=-